MSTPGAEPAWIVLGRSADDGVVAIELDAAGEVIGRVSLDADIAPWVAARERACAPRWVWSHTPRWYDAVLAAGVRVGRCHDLRLVHVLLRDSALVTASGVRAAVEWDAAPPALVTDETPALFDLAGPSSSGPPDDIDAALAELALQRAAVDGSADPERLRLLVAIESAGALIASEMRAAGLPWDEERHDRILTDVLGSRPAGGGLPLKVQQAADRVRGALGDPTASLDSQPKLLRALHRAGVLAASTSQWELAEYDHPVIAPLLEYKKLTRLMSANGWHWLDEWVQDGRFRPVYVPSGVVTGRWASSGGGALQLPRSLRAAVHADPGWTLVVADVAQLEPRVLAAMSGDRALADAAGDGDLYERLVSSGVVATRQEAKLALLGAMYGATTGDSARLLPRLRRAFPRAMGLVDDAARTGERGGVVSTWLGRSCPPASEGWMQARRDAGRVGATASDESHARRAVADRGRFTRNFVVQGTAAEWAVAWLGGIRGRLAALPEAQRGAAASGPVFSRRAHLAFFLHDEIIVHTPREHADEVATLVQEAADAATALVFGGFPIRFPLDLRVAASAEKT